MLLVTVILNLITLECQHAMFNMGEGIVLNTGIVSAEKWWS